MTADGVDAAWDRALAAEYRAVFGYALAGAHLRGTQHVHLAAQCSDAHEHLRDTTRAAIRAAARTPPAPAADYPSLYPVADAAGALRLALRLERECAEAWRALYAAAAARRGAAAGAAREPAQRALTASAVRAMRWRRIVLPERPTVAFPGT